MARPARLLLISATLLATVFGVAWAHAKLVRSDPAADAHLALPPAQLRLEFSENVVPATSRVELVAPDLQRFMLTLEGDSADSKLLHAQVPVLTVAGKYRVDWRLIGPDGHAVTGAFGFTIDSVPTPAPVQGPSETRAGSEPGPGAMDANTPFHAALRFFSLVSLVIVIGSVMFATFVLPRVGDSGLVREVDNQLRRWGKLAVGGLLVVAAIRLTSQGVMLAGSMSAMRPADLTGIVTGSQWGRGWLLQVFAAIALLFALGRSTPTRWSTIGVAAFLLAISASLLGHPAAVENLTGLAMSLDAAHIVAAGGWAGGIVIITLSALPQVLRLPVTNRVEASRSVLRAFTPLALTCALILALTGAASAWLELGSLDAFLNSSYGRTLLRKVVLVLIVAALGAYHWRVAQPSVGSDRSLVRLRWSLVLDVLVVLAVLVLTAILTGTAPPGSMS